MDEDDGRQTLCGIPRDLVPVQGIHLKVTCGVAVSLNPALVKCYRLHHHSFNLPIKRSIGALYLNTLISTGLSNRAYLIALLEGPGDGSEFTSHSLTLRDPQLNKRDSEARDNLLVDKTQCLNRALTQVRHSNSITIEPTE